MADDIRVPTGLTTDGLLGRRYLARFIDSIILVVFSVLAVGLAGLVVMVVVTGKQDPAATMPRWVTMLVMFPLVLSLWAGYGAALESSPMQATLGKRVMGLRVYNSEGGRLSFLQGLGRNAVKEGPFLLLGLVPGSFFGYPVLPLLWLIAHLIVIHQSPVNQAIHDRTAHTWVAAPEETTQLRIA